MTNNQQPGWPQQPNNQQPPSEGTPQPPIPPAPGQDGQTQQFPPYTPQPGQQPWTQQPGQQPHPEQWTQPGQQPQVQPPHAQQWPQQGQPPHGQQYGNPGDQYNQGAAFMQPPPGKGIPVWGWVAGGVGVVAILAVAGVMAFNGLSAGSNEPDPVAESTSSASAAPEASAAPTEAGDVYTFIDAAFTSAPVWSIKEPEGWAKEPVKDGMVNYKNAGLQCTFTTYQADLPAGGLDDDAATTKVMASEIAGVKSSLGKAVETVDDTRALYVKLGEGGQKIEMRQAELRFKNDSDADVVYRLAVRATTGGNGLMELAMACPGGMADDYDLWLQLAERVSMVGAP